MAFDDATVVPRAHRSLPASGLRVYPGSLPLALYIVVFSGSLYLLFGTFEDGAAVQKAGDSKVYLALLLVTYATMFYQLFVARAAALGALTRSITLLLFV